MTNSSYIAWDGKEYDGRPPDGWYLAGDARWWPQGYAPAVEEVASAVATEAVAQSDEAVGGLDSLAQASDVAEITSVSPSNADPASNLDGEHEPRSSQARSETSTGGEIDQSERAGVKTSTSGRFESSNGANLEGDNNTVDGQHGSAVTGFNRDAVAEVPKGGSEKLTEDSGKDSLNPAPSPTFDALSSDDNRLPPLSDLDVPDLGGFPAPEPTEVGSVPSVGFDQDSGRSVDDVIDAESGFADLGAFPASFGGDEAGADVTSPSPGTLTSLESRPTTSNPGNIEEKSEPPVGNREWQTPELKDVSSLQSADEPKSRWWLWLIFSLVLALLIAGGIAAFAVLRPGAGNQSADETSTNLGSFNTPQEVDGALSVLYPDDADEIEYRWSLQVVGQGATVEQVEGSRVLSVPIRVSFDSGADDTPLNRLVLDTVDQDRQTQTAVACPAGSQELDFDQTLSEGDIVEGNLCWEIADSNPASHLLAVSSTEASGSVYFAVAL